MPITAVIEVTPEAPNIDFTSKIEEKDRLNIDLIASHATLILGIAKKIQDIDIRLNTIKRFSQTIAVESVFMVNFL